MRMTVKSYLKTVEKAKAEAEARAIAAAATTTTTTTESSNKISPAEDAIARPSGDSPQDEPVSTIIPPASAATEGLSEEPGDDVQPSIEVSSHGLCNHTVSNVSLTGPRCRRPRR